MCCTITIGIPALKDFTVHRTQPFKWTLNVLTPGSIQHKGEVGNP